MFFKNVGRLEVGSNSGGNIMGSLTQGVVMNRELWLTSRRPHSPWNCNMCTYVRIHMRVYLYVYMCMYMYTYIYMYIHTPLQCTCMYTPAVYVCIYVYVYMYI